MIISLEQFSQLTLFDSRAGFLGMANAMDLLLVGPNSGWWSATIFEISNADRSETGHLINFMFDSMVGFSGSADRMALFPVTSKLIKSKLVAGRDLG